MTKILRVIGLLSLIAEVRGPRQHRSDGPLNLEGRSATSALSSSVIWS
ncbi:MAG: hypothetical protein ABGY15_06625 [bacterium]